MCWGLCDLKQPNHLKHLNKKKKRQGKLNLTHKSRHGGVARVRHAPPTKVVLDCLLPPLSSQIANLLESSLRITKSTTNACPCTHTPPHEQHLGGMGDATRLGFGRSGDSFPDGGTKLDLRLRTRRMSSFRS